MFKWFRLIIITTTVFCLFGGSLTLGAKKKPQQPDKFPPNPLEITTPDPLLPRSPDKQPLNVLEKRRLEAALDKLNQEAAVKLRAGDKVGAFDIWNRELRLRRHLGTLVEITALSRVGAIAYNENNRQQVIYITQRLQKIQQPIKSQTQPDLEILQALGQAYQQVRSPEFALTAYEQILVTVRRRKDTAKEVETLTTIGELHLSWFDYPKAAATYEELLVLANSDNNINSQIIYLQKLASIYTQAKEFSKSIQAKNQLVEIYRQNNNLALIPGLKLAIASEYESLTKENPDLIQEAFKNYQESYTTAWQLEQYARAGDALRKLIALYRAAGQIEDALQTSQTLIQTEQLAANFYGLMNAYDQIGQIYVERKEYAKALNAFQQGLKFAQQLKHDENYFNQQIKKISELMAT
ncbi:tetratricopeptide repeat protein [Calothrix rhizosoleniae]|uniref:tetratricopeptide repeat protein n=1 Tax=Calothrix rhizosoleniae TaxID=888997 RepID=UPI000B49B676|nr:tetratricopeptide repeat protein [Calothrix rhizosoleniae]